MPEAVYTVGHSTHSLPRFFELLGRHAITAVCDVRSQPYSRLNPQFNRGELRDALRTAGVRYVFLGKELGARSTDKSCYCNGQVQYDRLAKTDEFKHGLERVKMGSRSYRVALMCAERDPLHCHRAILVARQLVEQGVHIRHILANGQLEDHDQALNRLLRILNLQQGDMFQLNKDVTDEAYRRQNGEIGYRERSETTSNMEQYYTAHRV
jgi:uncharacterized protein (DUF488 family)